MKLEILGWLNFNPRKELKSMSWFRVQSDIAYSETLFGLTAEQKWLWIFLLSTCARKCSGVININFKFISHQTGISERIIKNTLQLFENKGLVSNTIEGDTTRSENGPYEEDRQTNKQTDLSLNFEALYQKYPKKIGKSAGLKTCHRKIKTQNEYENLSTAIDNFNRVIEIENTEKKYIKQFSTFMNCWEDYLEIDTGGKTSTELDNEMGLLLADSNPKKGAFWE